MVSAEDIATIERATLAAVAPERVETVGDWLVALSPGSIRRAKSAVPLLHDLAADNATIDRIETLFADAGLDPAFRLSDATGLAGVRAELMRRGYGFEQPTLVMTGTTSGMRALTTAAPAEVALRPDESWGAVFLGEGFDPVDGADRVRALSRGGDSVFASVRDEGRVIAVGAGSFGHGWASVHGMRTDRARRGEGLAGRVLAGLANAAEARGLARVFLQVEEENAPARALYRRAGFETAWRYFYWSRSGGGDASSG